MNSQSDPTRILWFALGLTAGVLVSYYWPHEPAFAAGVDRDTQGKYAICTVTTGASTGDALFVLDFLTGRIVGASMDPSSGKFTQYYMHNVMGDFQLTPDMKPVFTMTEGSLNIATVGGRQQPATGGLYIAELNTGRVNVYAFPFSISTRMNRNATPSPLIPINTFQFRQNVQ